MRRFAHHGLGTALLCASFLLITPAGTTHAHGGGVPLALWANDFTAEEAHCQRVIGEAATACANRIWSVRRACLRQVLDGAACDMQGTEDAIEAAQVHALNMIDPVCTDRTAGRLGFLGVFEIQGDLETFWQGFDDAMVSAVYRTHREGDTTALRCVRGTVRAATKLARFALRTRQRTLDRIAQGGLPPSVKDRLVQRAAARVMQAQAVLANQIAAVCPDADFASVYGQTASTILTGIAQRSECFAGAVYVQTRVVCPAPVCGNGIKEPGEECADGTY